MNVQWHYYLIDTFCLLPSYNLVYIFITKWRKNKSEKKVKEKTLIEEHFALKRKRGNKEIFSMNSSISQTSNTWAKWQILGRKHFSIKWPFCIHIELSTITFWHLHPITFLSKTNIHLIHQTDVRFLLISWYFLRFLKVTITCTVKQLNKLAVIVFYFLFAC